jgi:heme-degrading monooxygenase HmoA
MIYFSMLMITAHNKTAREVAQIWIDRRCIEEAAESIPGFLRGEVLVHDEADDKICVLCVWNSRSDYEAWQKCPLRDKQGADIAPLVSADVHSICFDQMHEVKRAE